MLTGSKNTTAYSSPHNCVCAASSFCSLHLLAACDNGIVGEGRRKTLRDWIVVCSYLIINPHWSVSTPPAHCSLFTPLLHQTVDGWPVTGHGGFVFINNTETMARQAGFCITINHHNPVTTIKCGDFTFLQTTVAYHLNIVTTQLVVLNQSFVETRVRCLYRKLSRSNQK